MRLRIIDINVLDVFILQILLGVFACILVFAFVAWYLEITLEKFCVWLITVMVPILLAAIFLWSFFLH